MASRITSDETIHALFTLQKHHAVPFVEARSYAHRTQRLRALLSALFEHQDEIRAALQQDFCKPQVETDLTEFLVVASEIRHTLRQLKRWMRPTKVRPTLGFLGTKAWVKPEPRGRVLIISPWNFPFNLALGTLVSAVAAGNTVILKPSEMAPATAELVQKLVSKVFPQEEVAVVQGAVEETQTLLSLPFDHIFFTGSPQVGKIVMAAASKHLSSVTLELGGKSPVIIDETANIKEAASKLAWAKCVNAGQTCVAPDYVLIHESQVNAFKDAISATLALRYGSTKEDMMRTPDYARIINTAHFERILHLQEDAIQRGARISFGGYSDKASRFVSPTLLENIHTDSAIFHEEIFGPLLPIIPVKNTDEALHIIKDKEKPLALYHFTTNSKAAQHVMTNSSAGTTAINDAVLQFSHGNLPFGGVNNSGLGNAHGEFGFKTFSHERAVLYQPLSTGPMSVFYPPYHKWVESIVKIALKYL